jgi:hypothetical protein
MKMPITACNMLILIWANQLIGVTFQRLTIDPATRWDITLLVMLFCLNVITAVQILWDFTRSAPHSAKRDVGQSAIRHQ